MRVYSASQGKFIDTGGGSTALGGTTPTGPTGIPSLSPTSGSIPGGGQTSPIDNQTPDYSNTTSLGIPKSTLQNMFFSLGIQNPKEASNLNSLMGLVTPSASEVTQRTNAAQTAKETKQGLDAMNQVWKLYKQMDPIELNFIPYSIAGKFPRLAPNKAAINTLFYTQIEPALRKQVVAGRATQQEIQWFKDALFPTSTDTEKTYKQRWNYAVQRFGSITGDNSSIPTIPGSGPSSNLDNLYNQSLGQ